MTTNANPLPAPAELLATARANASTPEAADATIIARGGKSGRKLHVAYVGSTVTECGKWLRADASYYRVNVAAIPGLTHEHTCERCAAAVARVAELKAEAAAQAEAATVELEAQADEVAPELAAALLGDAVDALLELKAETDRLDATLGRIFGDDDAEAPEPRCCYCGTVGGNGCVACGLPLDERDAQLKAEAAAIDAEVAAAARAELDDALAVLGDERIGLETFGDRLERMTTSEVDKLATLLRTSAGLVARPTLVELVGIVASLEPRDELGRLDPAARRYGNPDAGAWAARVGLRGLRRGAEWARIVARDLVELADRLDLEAHERELDLVERELSRVALDVRTGKLSPGGR